MKKTKFPDITLTPIPNKNCKWCYGRGYIKRAINTFSPAEIMPCKCLRFRQEITKKIRKLRKTTKISTD